MQRFLSVCMVAVWVLVLLCGSTRSSSESCGEGTTTVPGACTTKTAATPCSTSAESQTTYSFSTTIQSEHGDFEVHSTVQDVATTEEVTSAPAAEDKHGGCLQRPTSDIITSAKRGSWQVMAGYSREFVTSPFCPELAFDFDPEPPNNITISWSEAEAFENVIPHGEMTLDDAGNLADKDGFHEVKVIKLDKFLVLRVRNSNFWRVVYLYPVSGTRDSLLGDLLGFMMSTHSDFMKSDGPAWYTLGNIKFRVENALAREVDGAGHPCLPTALSNVYFRNYVQ